MRIGIFGGSFDPVHLGHLWIAEAALEQLQLDQVRWVPAATSPLKRHGPVASDQDRLQMVRLAVSGTPQHVVDDREILRGDISYTFDTLAQIRDEWTDAELFLILGSDSLASFGKWFKADQLLDLATLAVVQRGGDPPIDFSVLSELTNPARIDELKAAVIAMPLIELSSTELRDRISVGQSIRFRVPKPVEALIAAEQIYR